MQAPSLQLHNIGRAANSYTRSHDTPLISRAEVSIPSVKCLKDEFIYKSNR